MYDTSISVYSSTSCHASTVHFRISTIYVHTSMSKIMFRVLNELNQILLLLTHFWRQLQQQITQKPHIELKFTRAKHVFTIIIILDGEP